MRKALILSLIIFGGLNQLSGQVTDKKAFADSLNRKSAEYLANDNFTGAILNANQSLKIYQEISDNVGIAKSFYQLGESHANLGDYNKAYSYAKQSLKIYDELKDKHGIADCYEIIGNYFELQRNELQNALNNYWKGINYCEEVNYKRRKAYLLGNIARVHFKLNLLDEALDYNFKSLEIKEEINDKKGAGYSLHKIGQIYLKIGNVRKATEYALKSMELGQAYNYLENIKRSAGLLNEIYKQQGNYKGAFEMYELYIKSRDSINNISSQKIALQKEMQYQFDKKEALAQKEQEQKDILSKKDKQKQRIILLFVLGGLLLVIVFAITMYNRFKITQKQRNIIALQKQEVEKQKKLVDDKQREILDSITYAKRLQEAILPPQDYLNTQLANNFIYYRPKDIVAGDFYWAEEIDNLFFIAAADSTGHGVPGAMVSVVCSNALNRTIKEFKLAETGKILDKTRELVLETFEKSSSEVKDGMDISLLCVDTQNKNVFWSGANNPLWYIQNGELIEIKADKQPIGKTDYPKPFTTHKIEYKENTTFYLFTDGLADQFGGPNGKKFKYKQFSDLLLKNNNLSLKQQADIINKVFSDWKGDIEQVDDVCVIGVKI